MLSLAVGSAAMIVLFSVFNGFERLIADLYTAFYSDMQIAPATGKFFALSPEKIAAIRAIKGIETVAPVIEDNVLVNTDDEQIVVSLRGVNSDYFKVNNLQPYIAAGRDSVHAGSLPTALVGLHIAARLGLSVDNDFSRLTVYYPNANAENIALNPLSAFSTLDLRPDGIFRVQEDFDARYVLASLPLVQQLFGVAGKWSSIEMRLARHASPLKVQASLKALLGKDFLVNTRFEQNRTLNTVMRTEKWATYAILLFILLIASVNMIGAMSLLVLEKQKDMAVLTAMGAKRSTIRAIFLIEGMLWAALGGGIGLLAGLILCAGQQQWGWVKLNGDFIIQAYPVAIQFTDAVVIAITVLAVGAAAAAYPAASAGRKEALTAEVWR